MSCGTARPVPHLQVLLQDAEQEQDVRVRHPVHQQHLEPPGSLQLDLEAEVQDHPLPHDPAAAAAAIVPPTAGWHLGLQPQAVGCLLQPVRLVDRGSPLIISAISLKYGKNMAPAWPVSSFFFANLSLKKSYLVQRQNIHI